MEPMWCGHPSFQIIVTKIFDNTNTFDKVINLFKEEAITWNKSTFGNIFCSMKRILARHIVIQNSSRYQNRPIIQDLDNDLLIYYENLLKEENVFRRTN